MRASQKAAALYIHIPFCLRKCLYCNFYSESVDSHEPERYMRALCRELAERRSECGPLSTVFLGGGTPSILSVDLLRVLMECLSKKMALSSDAEITIEANPATIDEKGLCELRSIGFNRLSLGVQSCRNGELRQLGRPHNWQQALDAFDAARRAGFDNISVDLIYGVPGQGMAGWRESLAQVVRLHPEHISAYELTPEPQTPLHDKLRTGEISLPSEESIEEMFLFADDYLGSMGYEHYEISNYALSGYRCRHNMTYWERAPYVGLGPAAHSFDGEHRRANIEDVREYMAALEKGRSVQMESARISEYEIICETIFLGLRTSEGVTMSELPAHSTAGIEKALQDQRLQGLVLFDGNQLRLTRRGWLLSNEVIAILLSHIEKHCRA
ncbi:MAG TPA: radical SAM family heme chaperone HemW [Dissulfurispiraceae bacterium]|nr:radical SAM family heme chaperone HemW [Dissulfurispiraceae bacterium]